jgi:4-amino-4-deoxy-L-arabinose transferase-like glycosyltransferase
LTRSFKEFLKQNTTVILSALVAISVAILYLSVASARLTNANFGGDGGDFLAAILTRGIPHPTGYPTYVLLGIDFQYIPISTPVFRGVLASLIPAALGAGLLTGWMGYIGRNKNVVYLGAATLVGFAWGFTPLLTSQATIVEVHGLQSLFIILFLWWITLNLDENPEKNKKWILGLSLFLGLGLGNHITIVLLVPAAIFAMIYCFIQSRSWKFILAQLSLILLGILVYLYLPLRAQFYPPVNWGNPQTLSGFLWEVTANPYRGLLFGINGSVLWERIRSISSLLLDQFGALGLIAGVIGLIQYHYANKWLRWVLICIFVIYFVFAIGYNTQDSIGYVLPAIMIFAVWIGLAVPSLWQLRWKRIPYGSLLAGVLLLSIVWRMSGTMQRVDPRSQDQPARFAESFLREAPSNAIVYTTTDQDTFPLWFYHFGLGQRPDLRIVVLPLTQFVWYQQTLVHTYTDLDYPVFTSQDVANANWAEQIHVSNPTRPVCRTMVSSETETGVSFECSLP